MALSLLHNEADAEDAAQEAFLKAFRNLAAIIIGIRITSRWKPPAGAWMPIVASASALRPMATRTPLIAMTAVQALCKTINTRLVMLTSHVRLPAGPSDNAGAGFCELPV
jgi:hypothetical protein